MKTAYKLAAAAIIAAVSVSCTKDEMFSSQESRIESFINSQTAKDSTITVTSNGGSNRVTIRQGDGEPLAPDGTISFYYAGYIFSNGISNSNLFATNSLDVAKTCKWDTSDESRFSIKTLNLKETGLIEGLEKGLVGVRGGEICYILFSGKHALGKSTLGTIPANSALVYQIWVESVSNE